MRKVKKRKRSLKKDTLSFWKKSLWKVFSFYIRTRDNFTCFTCGKKGKGSGIHAGHFIPKVKGGMILYFDERNVHAQCYYDNINLGGYGAEYYRRMVSFYGQELVDSLFVLRDAEEKKKYTIEEYQDLIYVYKEKTKELYARNN